MDCSQHLLDWPARWAERPRALTRRVRDSLSCSYASCPYETAGWARGRGGVKTAVASSWTGEVYR